jgi:hypothetical protein
MPKYKPNYPDTDKVPDTLTQTGRTSRQCVVIEESAQRAVAESPEWLLARKLNSVRGEYSRGDSRKELETLGFDVLGDADDLFYKVQPPKGWNKSTQGYWTSVIDVDGKERISQFYKGAFYDRDAFLNILK